MNEQDHAPGMPNQPLSLDSRPEGAEQEALPVADSSAAAQLRRLVGGGNLFLAGLFAAGISGIYAMSLHNGPQKASAAQLQTELQVDAAVTGLNCPPVGSTDKDVTEAFYLEARVRQVPISELTNNPFAYTPSSPPVVEFRSPAAQAAKPAKDAGRSEAVKTVESLVLQSVLTGSRGSSAMISNNLLTEGQSICGWTVESIHPRQVVLRKDELRHVLELSQ